MLPKSKELLETVAKGEISSQTLIKLLKSRADINAQNEDGNTALMIAVKRGFSHTVNLLLGQKAAVNTENIHHNTALMQAIRDGHYEIAKVLLDKNADPNIQNVWGTTALMAAANACVFPLVESLVEKKAAINEQDNDDNTALIFLLSNPTIKLHDAAALTSIPAKNLKTPSKNDTGVNPLLDRSDHFVKIFRKLLDAKANIELKNRDGKNALIRVTECGYTPLVDLLLKKDAKLEVEQDGHTPLLIAASLGHFAIAELLLDKKAAVNAINKQGDTALMIAARLGHSAIVKLLLEKKAAVNTINKKDHTALRIAAEHNSATIVKMLLKAHADPDIETKEGNTALIKSAEKSYTGIVNLLLKNGAKTNVQTKRDGYTALMFAAYNSRAPIVKMLLEAGANVDAVDKRGDTALYTAFSFGNAGEGIERTRAKRLPIIKLLLNADANLDIPNNEGKTALMKKEHYFPGSKAFERYLKEKQSTKDIYGLTDYQFRIWKNHDAKNLLFINNYYLYFPDAVCFIICLYLLPTDREEKVITDELHNFVKNSPALHIYRLETDCAAVRRNDPLLEKLLPPKPKEGFLENIKNFLTSSTEKASPEEKNTNVKLIKLLLEEFSQFIDDEAIQSGFKKMCDELAKTEFKLSVEEAEGLKSTCLSIIEYSRGDAFDKTRLKELYKTLSLILSGIPGQDNSTSCTQRRGASPGR